MFDDQELASLADSIRVHGVLQPVVVRRKGDGYELIAGERRWRASQQAGLHEIPAVVRDVDDETAAGLALIENLQRSDLNPVERAEALRSLQERFSMTHQQIAERVGLDRSTVANLIRLTALEPEVLSLLASGSISPGHARALLAVPGGAGRVRLAERVAKEQWSVRRLERYAKAATERSPTDAGENRSSPAAGANPEIERLERLLSEQLGTKVRVRPSDGGDRGEIALAFFSLDHFDSLLARLGVDLQGD